MTIRCLSPVFGFLVTVAMFASAQEVEWKDPSPHIVKLVTVEEGVQLEVLDWGGSGRPLVLLAGLGDTAHVYDDIAVPLTARYRVVGITRRAFGRSSAPATGYGFARLGEDVIRVIDALGMNKPVVIGHSFAGEEMHVLGARYPEQIAGLVYVDAAFNRRDDSDNEAYNAAAKGLPTPQGPAPRDMASFTALRSYLESTQGAAGPEGHLRAKFLANPDGSIRGQWTPEVPIRQEYTKEMRAAYNPYNPAPIRVPALAIYAVPKSMDDFMRRGSTSRLRFPEDFIVSTTKDPDLRARVDKLFQLEHARFEGHSKWFKTFAPQARVVEVSGPHYIILTNTAEVMQHIEAFVASLPVSR